MKKNRLAACMTVWLIIVPIGAAEAVESQDPVLLEQGRIRGTLTGGVSILDRRASFNADASLRVGLGARLIL